MAEPHAFPVPFMERVHNQITFTDLPDSGSIKIFTVAGDKVAELPIPMSAGQRDWNTRNDAGKKVASGVYLYQVSGNGI